MTATRSAVLVKPRKIEIRSFPYPKTGEGALIVKVEAAGVCGSDSRFYAGRSFGPEHPGDFPLILGHENVGRIKEIGGDEVLDMHGSHLKEGDRVVWYPLVPCGECYYCRFEPHSKHLCRSPSIYGWVNCEREENKPWIFGGYGEHVYIRPGTFLWKVPSQISLEQAVMLDTLVSVRGVEKGLRISASSPTVVVLGDGPIGMCASAKAKVLGAYRVLLIGHHQHRLDQAAIFGVDQVCNETDIGSEATIEEVLKVTDRLGADVVVDCTGSPTTLIQGLKILRRGGIFVEIGCILHSGAVQINPALDLVAKDLSLIAQYYAPPQQYERDLKLVSSSRIPFGKMVTHHYGLDEAETALKTHSAREGLKVVIHPNH